MSDNDLSLLVGKTLELIDWTKEEMTFVCKDGDAFRAYHMQDCCENVEIHDIAGDIASLTVGSPIVEAVEEVSQDWPSDVEPSGAESFTWTTHRFKTADGSEVAVRWLGESNGYYSESVYFTRTHKPISNVTEV